MTRKFGLRHSYVLIDAYYVDVMQTYYVLIIYNFGYTWATRDLTHESMCGILHINDVDHKPTWATHGLHMNLHILHV